MEVIDCEITNITQKNSSDAPDTSQNSHNNETMNASQDVNSEKTTNEKSTDGEKVVSSEGETIHQNSVEAIEPYGEICTDFQKKFDDLKQYIIELGKRKKSEAANLKEKFKVRLAFELDNQKKMFDAKIIEMEKLHKNELIGIVSETKKKKWCNHCWNEVAANCVVNPPACSLDCLNELM